MSGFFLGARFTGRLGRGGGLPSPPAVFRGVTTLIAGWLMFTEANKKFTMTLFCITAIICCVTVCVTVLAIKVKSGQNILMGTIISFATLGIIQLFIVLRQTSGLEQRELIQHNTTEVKEKVVEVDKKLDEAKQAATVAKSQAAASAEGVKRVEEKMLTGEELIARIVKELTPLLQQKKP